MISNVSLIYNAFHITCVFALNSANLLLQLTIQRAKWLRATRKAAHALLWVSWTIYTVTVRCLHVNVLLATWANSVKASSANCVP